MILSRGEILANINTGRISIDPFDPSLLKDSSYTFTLSSEYFEYEKTGEVIDFLSDSPPRIQKSIPPGGLYLNPGAFILCKTAEHLRLGPDVSCFLSARGSCAQVGLSVLHSSNYAEPRTEQHLLLEVSNAGPFSIRLTAGIPMVKGIFMPITDSSRLHVVVAAE